MITPEEQQDLDSRRPEGWLWQLGKMGRLSQSEMEEWSNKGDGVQWFRTEAEMRQWQEQKEQKLVELLWTIRSYIKMQSVWSQLGDSHANQPGHVAYARQKAWMYERWAEDARNLVRLGGYQALLSLTANVIEFIKGERMEEQYLSVLYPSSFVKEDQLPSDRGDIEWEPVSTATLQRLVLRYSPTTARALHSLILSECTERYLQKLRYLKLDVPTKGSLDGFEKMALRHSQPLRHLGLDFGIWLDREPPPPLVLPALPTLSSLTFTVTMTEIKLPDSLMSHGDHYETSDVHAPPRGPDLPIYWGPGGARPE
ncbi:hypothetical protein DFH09DRAFT_1092536 [Mycena vulgaris]|nr:hypothetical protein DFH09DRAFT_1092536 [Mycena vulgaris]